MAFPTAVNDQITDSVTQSNVKVLAEAPASALSNLYQTAGHSYKPDLPEEFQHSAMMHSHSTQGVTQLYSVDTAATGSIFR